MSEQEPTVVLVHGAFAESASWNPVIERLHARGLDVVAAANPLRSITGDAAYVRDVIAGLATPVILVGHSYGGTVITEAAAANPSVIGLVYVAGFAPDHGESALELSNQFPGSTLADTLTAYPVSTGGNEFAIQQDAFHHQFAADVAPAQAALLGATQRPVTQTALAEGLPTNTPAWKTPPLLVRVRRPRPHHPTRTAPLPRPTRRSPRHTRDHRCLTRTQHLVPRRRHRNHPHRHQHHRRSARVPRG